MSPKTPAATDTARRPNRPQPAAAPAGKPRGRRRSPESTPHEEDRGRFRDLLTGREEPAAALAATSAGTAPTAGRPAAPAPTGIDVAAKAVPRALAGGAGPSINIDRVLGQQATDVQLATDGRGHHVLRFEVASGDLRGTQLTVSSEGGVVSASAVAPSAEMTLRLEQALESARLSLEARGIDISAMDVRAGTDDAGRQAAPGEPPREDGDNHPDRDAGKREPPPARRPAEAVGVDFFI